MEKDAEGEFERVMGMASRDWVAKNVSEKTISAAEADKERRHLRHQLGNAYYRGSPKSMPRWPTAMIAW